MKNFSIFLLLLIPLLAHSVVKVYEETPIPEQFNQLQNIGIIATTGDIDRDGKIDLLVINNNQLNHYEQSSLGNLDFELISTNFLDISPQQHSFCLYDLDDNNRFELLSNIGDDIIVYSQSNPYSYTFYNDFTYAPFPDDGIGISSFYFACGKINGDDENYLITGYSSTNPTHPGIPNYVYLHLLSPGNNSFDVVEENFTNTTFSSISMPALTYYDHDDNLDLVVGSGGGLQYFEQESANSFNFIPISSGFDGIYSSHSKPEFCDLNNDGLDDLILYDAYTQGLKIFLRKLWADYSYEQLTPNSYQFTNNSIGDYAICQWYFDGDNVPDSIEENPTWIFPDAGEHEVHLVLRDGDFCDINTQYISVETGSEQDEIPEIEISLSNHPNPFNPTTTIQYNLVNDSNIELSIFNINGQKVKTLINENQTKGQHSSTWDGTDNNQKSVSSGIYLYKLKTDRNETINRMLLLK